MYMYMHIHTCTHKTYATPFGAHVLCTRIVKTPLLVLHSTVTSLSYIDVISGGLKWGKGGATAKGNVAATVAPDFSFVAAAVAPDFSFVAAAFAPDFSFVAAGVASDFSLVAAAVAGKPLVKFESIFPAPERRGFESC